VTARASQLDPAYASDAVAAFQHVLEIDPKNADALRGLANMHYDRNEYREAIPIFERYLTLRPDDPSARTDLGTMYLSVGDRARAIASYQDVIKRSPSFMQAYYNLAVTYHRQGNDEAAVAELQTARGLATDDAARKQIDDMLATVRGEPGAAPAGPPGNGPAVTTRSAFQTAVEAALHDHPIMGPRIVRMEWTGPAAGRVLVQNFPMEGMPPAVREKFAARLGEQLRSAQETNKVEGPVRLEIADVGSGTVMATVTP
jgi:tetratricopeptide (TPR) repeat protein